MTKISSDLIVNQELILFLKKSVTDLLFVADFFFFTG